MDYYPKHAHKVFAYRSQDTEIMAIQALTTFRQHNCHYVIQVEILNSVIFHRLRLQCLTKRYKQTRFALMGFTFLPRNYRLCATCWRMLLLIGVEDPLLFLGSSYNQGVCALFPYNLA